MNERTNEWTEKRKLYTPTYFVCRGYKNAPYLKQCDYPEDLFWCKINNYHAMGKISRQQTGDIFLFFFLENRIWHFMQIFYKGDKLHEESAPIF